MVSPYNAGNTSGEGSRHGKNAPPPVQKYPLQLSDSGMSVVPEFRPNWVAESPSQAKQHIRPNWSPGYGR